MLTQILPGTNLAIDRTTAGEITLNVAAGGGTGDITAVTTAATSGLAGGTDSGAADLVLDFDRMTNTQVVFIEGTGRIAYERRVSGSGTMYHATFGQVFEALVDDTTLEWDNSGDHVRVKADGITNDQIAPNTIREGRLAVSNTPTAGHVLSYESGEMVWVEAPGTGDITGIVTETSSGLQGGEASGEATLALDFDSLPILSSTDITLSDLFVVRDVTDTVNPYKQLPKGNLAGALAGSPTLGTSGGTLRVNDLGIDTAQLAAEAVTEGKMDISNVPTSGYVLGWNGSREWNGVRRVLRPRPRIPVTLQLVMTPPLLMMNLQARRLIVARVMHWR